MSARRPMADAATEFPAAVHRELVRLVGQAGPGVVAVSGGGDSVALLCALTVADRASPLVVAHLNHRLRGAESDGDAAFVAGLLPHWPHITESASIADIAAADNDNLEAVARRVRYDFLARVAKESGASWVATGHTRNDQAETVLHRLIRGTGLRGLRGIAPVRELAPGVLLVRPMLRATRADVVQFLQAIGQPWREDSTNASSDFTRNRLRHELLPILRTYNPAIDEVLARTASQANDLYAEIDREAVALLDRAAEPAGSVVILKPWALVGVSEPRLREMLIVLWERQGWPRGQMSQTHWGRVVDVVAGRARACDLPEGLRIVRGERTIQLGPDVK